MKLTGRLILIPVVAGALLAGFVLGQQVQATPFAPGSQEDPLVAKSYLEEQVELRVGELEEEIAALTAKANQMQGVVDELNRKLGL